MKDIHKIPDKPNISPRAPKPDEKVQMMIDGVELTQLPLVAQHFSWMDKSKVSDPEVLQLVEKSRLYLNHLLDAANSKYEIKQ